MMDFFYLSIFTLRSFHDHSKGDHDLKGKLKTECRSMRAFDYSIDR